jgi:hypothetical protein
LLGNAQPAGTEGGGNLPQRTLSKTDVRVPILGRGTVAVDTAPPHTRFEAL